MHHNTFRERYCAYLQSPEWRAIRLQVLEECDHTCQICGKSLYGKGYNFQVHHRRYKGVLYREREWIEAGRCKEVLWAVHRECHEELHGLPTWEDLKERFDRL
jgi:hypothetical protein